MKQIRISGPNVERIVKLDFDVAYGPTYQQFIQNPEYKEFIDLLPGETITLLGNERKNEFGVDIAIYKEFDFLLHYDLHEQYSGLVDKSTSFNFFGEGYAGNTRFYNPSIDTEVSYAKSMLTKSLTQTESHDDIPIRTDGIKTDMFKNVIYTEESKRNENMAYMKFITLISLEPIYIIYQILSNQYIISSESKLPHYLATSSLTQKTDNLFQLRKHGNFWTKIEAIKSRYNVHKDEPDVRLRMLKDIKDLVTTDPEFQNMRGSFRIQDGIPYSMEGQTTTKDPDFKRWQGKLKEQFRFETNVAGEEKIVSAKVTKKFSYKPDGKKPKDT